MRCSTLKETRHEIKVNFKDHLNPFLATDCISGAGCFMHSSVEPSLPLFYLLTSSGSSACSRSLLSKMKIWLTSQHNTNQWLPLRGSWYGNSVRHCSQRFVRQNIWLPILKKWMGILHEPSLNTKLLSYTKNTMEFLWKRRLTEHN